MTIVLLVDDHPLVVDALRRELEARAGLVVHVATDFAAGRVALARLQPDVCVCDVRLPDGSGLKLIEEAHVLSARTAFIVLSSFDTTQYIVTAQRLGAAGYLLKTEAAGAIVAAIQTVAGGGTAFGVTRSEADGGLRLTDRDRDVVAGVVAGLTNDEIAGRLGISRKGVEAHLSRLYERAGVASRTELAVRAASECWIEVG